jgi:toxin ParE1/3/4
LLQKLSPIWWVFHLGRKSKSWTEKKLQAENFLRKLKNAFRRFWVAADPNVDRFNVRDVDSRLNTREKAAVDRLMTQAEALREAPETGRLVRRGLRELEIAETPFALVYRVNRKSERVEILHIADGAPLQRQPTER